MSSNDDGHILGPRQSYEVYSDGERVSYESRYVDDRRKPYQVRQRLVPPLNEGSMVDETDQSGRKVSPGKQSSVSPFSHHYWRADSGYPSTSPVRCLTINL